MMNKKLFSVVSLIAPVFALVLSVPVWGEGVSNIECPSAQLDRLHTHWHSLVLEKDAEKRSMMVAEHRKLVAEAKQAGIASDKSKSMTNCEQKSYGHHHDLSSMAEMHTMMLNMIEGTSGT